MVAVWLASRSQQYPSASERYSYNRLRNRFVAAFRPSSQTSFSGLWQDTAGESCVGDPVLPRSLPYFIQLLSAASLKGLRATPLDAAMVLCRRLVRRSIKPVSGACC